MAFKIPKIRLKAVDETQAAFNSATRNVNQLNRSATRMSGAMNKNRRIIQNAGFQISDFAVQVGAGQSAILAMTQQLPQFVQGFGAVGGIAAAGITIFGSLWLAINRSGAAMSSLTPIVGILEDQLGGLMDVLSRFGNVMIDVANVVVNNLDRIIITGLVIAGFFLGKWVKAFLAARIATFSLMGALNLLKATFLRFLPFALLLALGEMVFLFLKLKKGAGSFGAVLGLLGDVAKEVIGRMTLGFSGLSSILTGVAASFKLGFLNAFNDVLRGYETFINASRRGAAKLLKWFEPDKSMEQIMADFGPKFTADLVDVTGAADKAGAAFKRALEQFRLAKGPLASVEALRAVLASVDAEGKRIDIRDWFKGMGDDDDGTSKIKSRFMEIKDVVESLAVSMSKSVGDALTSMVHGTKTAKEAFKDMARSIIKQLFDVLVVQRLVAGLSQILGGDIGSGGGFLGSIFGGGRAHGGPVSAGKSYLVGERGPELFTPSGGGSIDPRGSSGSNAPVIVNQTINVQAGVAQTVRAEMVSLLPAFKQQAIEAVSDVNRRSVRA